MKRRLSFLLAAVTLIALAILLRQRIVHEREQAAKARLAWRSVFENDEMVDPERAVEDDADDGGLDAKSQDAMQPLRGEDARSAPPP